MRRGQKSMSCISLGIWLFCCAVVGTTTVRAQDEALTIETGFETPPLTEETESFSGPITQEAPPAVTVKENTDDDSASLDVPEAEAVIEYVDYALSPVGAVEAPVPVTTIVDGSQRITINLDGVSLEDTLRMFAQTANANIIAAPNMLTGLFVTVTLNDVDWVPALRSILEIHDFTLAERTPESGVFTVQRRGVNAPEPTSVKTFFLDYTTSLELHEPVQKMLTPGKTDISALQFNSRNALVVRSTESNMGELEKLIEELDRPAKQILIEVKILELNDKVAREVGVKWDFLRQLNIGSVGYNYSRDYSDRQSTAYTDYERSGRDLLAESTDQDNGSSQVFSDQNNPLPVSTFQRQIASDASVSDQRSRSSGYSYDNTYEVLKEVVSGNSLNLILDPEVFSIIISALEETDGVSVVSNPKIITTSGSTGSVFKVVDVEPVLYTTITKGTEDSPGDTVTVENNPIEVGIKLNVTATVKTDDFIEALINPVLDRIIGEKSGADGNIYPVVSSKEIQTVFTLRSGQTVAIGGLTQSEGFRNREAVPLLGNLPIIGRLFSHDSVSDEKTETIIFVTLTTVDPATITSNDGVPEDARLVFKRLLSDKTSLEKFKLELDQLQQPKAMHDETGNETPTPAKRKFRRK